MELKDIADKLLVAADWLIARATDDDFLIQLGIIAVSALAAALLTRLLKPRIEERARAIEGRIGLLRVIVAFLKRLEWFALFMLVGLAYVTCRALAWPAQNYLLYATMLLSGAWFLVYLVSHVIRSRTLGNIFAVVAWTWVTAAILGITGDIAQALDSAGFTVGDFRFSLLRVLKGVAFLGFLLWISLKVGDFLDRRIQDVDELTPSLRVLLGKILRIAILILAFLIFMQGLGIDLTALTVLSGAVGVGIGFGLQKVVSNFISGIIILMDRSIKPGDTITLGETFGWVRELRARFVSVITRDGREYLIPNEDFITREVVNWSFSDKFVRLDVPFGVAYDSDPHQVTKLAINAASTVDRVDTKHNKPVCWMTEFGDSSINFVLRFWIDDPQGGLTNIRGKVLLALWDAFKEHAIKIPYPHREVIMRRPLRQKGAAADEVDDEGSTRD